ncbi:hypothetical protein ACR6HW_14155 [Fusibacter sp. JL298sf-3]
MDGKKRVTQDHVDAFIKSLLKLSKSERIKVYYMLKGMALTEEAVENEEESEG